MQRLFAPVLVLAALLCGCATPVGRPITQTVRVETPGCATASCTISNDRGSWRVERTPGEVELISSREPLKVLCRSDDAEGAADTPSALSGTHGVGAVAGGLAGGAAVGVAVGSVALAFIPALGVLLVLTGAALGASAGTAIEHSQQSVAYPPVISIALSCKAPGELTTVLRPARFGVGFRRLTAGEAAALGLGERGALRVTEVASGSVAEAAGLRRDDVLLAANGQPVTDAAQFEAVAVALVPGTVMQLKVWRSGEALELTLQLPQAPP